MAALRSAHYGEGNIPILLANVSCTGDESSLTKCKHNGIGIHDCEHLEDVAVDCFGMFILQNYTIYIIVY